MPFLKSYKSWVIMAVMLWLIFTIVILEKTGCVIVDGFQSLGACASSRYPGDLTWKGLGDFLGYDHYWGFHWHGWPLLYSIITSILGWNSLVATICVCVLWLAAALTMRSLAAQAWGEGKAHRLSDWAFCYVLVQPLFLVSAQSFRPEIVTALLLLVLLTTWQKAASASTKWSDCLFLLILPSMHPLGLIVPGSWIAWGWLGTCWKERKSSREWSFRAAWLFAGLLLFFLWHAQAGGAPWRQFITNIEQQGHLTRAMGLGHDAIFRFGWCIMPMKLMWPMLFGASLTALAVLVRALRNNFVTDLAVQAAVAWIAALLFMVATKNPNALHLICVLPFAMLLCVNGLSDVSGRLRIKSRPILSVAVVLLLSFPITLIAAKRTLGLWNADFVGYREKLSALYDDLASKSDGTLYIPVSLWECAAERSRAQEYRFSTFPNILTTQLRIDYEKTIFASAKPGDLIVIDDHQEVAGVFNEHEETAMKQKFLLPWKNSEWKLVDTRDIGPPRVMGASSKFRIYQRL